MQETYRAPQRVGVVLQPIHGRFRTRIKALYRDLPGVHGEDGKLGHLNAERRRQLERCIFAEQDDFEHDRAARGLSRHPQVEVMNAVRNCLLDDMSAGTGNESHPDRRLRWPHVEAMAALIQRRMPSKAAVAEGRRIGLARIAVLRGDAKTFAEALEQIPLAPEGADADDELADGDVDEGDDDGPDGGTEAEVAQ